MRVREALGAPSLSHGPVITTQCINSKKFLAKTIRQARKSPQADLWNIATDEEYLSLINNGTWELVKRLPGVKVPPCFWLFSVKTDKFGLVNRHKARLVALGNRQNSSGEKYRANNLLFAIY